jgi:hypothetical protein
MDFGGVGELIIFLVQGDFMWIIDSKFRLATKCEGTKFRF